MQIEDSRTTWREYWTSRPLALRLSVSALLAGLLAIYSVMGFLALFGIWRNNLFKLDTNWPWAFPLAGFSLLGLRLRKQILVHAVVFVPLLALMFLMASSAGMLMQLRYYWPGVFCSVAIPVANLSAFRWLVAKVESDQIPAGRTHKS